MTHPEHSPKKPTAAPGFLALLWNLLRADGTGMPKITKGAATGGRALNPSQNHDQSASEQQVYEHDQQAYGGEGLQRGGISISHVRSFAAELSHVGVKCAKTVTTLCRNSGRRVSAAHLVAVMLTICGLMGVSATSALATPEPPTLELTAKTATEASLRATVTPAVVLEGDTYELLYKKSPTECKTGSHSPSGLVISEEIPETLTTLEPGATYTACLQVENAAHEQAESPPVTFTLLAESPSTSTPAQSITSTSAVLEGTLNPTATGKAGWHFAYSNPGGSSCTEGPTTAQEVEVEGKALPEHKEVTGLEPGQTYVFCLVATNELGEAAAGNEVSFTTEAVAPVITGEYPSEIEPETATLNASIDPGGAETTYHFEYLTEAEFKANGETFAGATTTPESASIGADNTKHPATASLEKLKPGTTYHYRAVATNSQSSAGGTPGPDATFATPALPTATTAETCPNAQLRAEQPYGLTLPDCRAYEMVSPLDKDGAGITATDARASVAKEGEEPAITYESVGSFAEPKATFYTDRYVARRTSQGWARSTQNITPPLQPNQTSGSEPFHELWFTPELSNGLLLTEGGYPLTQSATAGYSALYLADTGAGASAGSESSYQLVSTVNNPLEPPYIPATESDAPLHIDGASTDLSHVVFSQEAPLTPGAPTNGSATANLENVYEWVQGSSVLHLVDVPPEGESFAGIGGGSVGAPGNANNPVNQDVWHAVSANGSRVFFTGAETSTTAETPLGQLYVRENPEQPPVDGSDCAVPGDACTIEVSESQRKVPDPHGAAPREPTVTRPARYWGANVEGSKVFFTSNVELTEDAQTGPEDNAPNLYEYDVETKQLTDLSVDELTANKTGDTDGADVLGLVTASEDGSYVYFVAEGELAPGATSGQPNMYLYHAGRTLFIATLAPATEKSPAYKENRGESGGDSEDWEGAQPEPESTNDAGAEEYGGPGTHTVRVTPDGTTLAFQSTADLTGYDNRQAESGECESIERRNEIGREAGDCREVYLYHATTGRISCASCDPSGARPVGPAQFGPEYLLTGQTLKASSPFYEPRNLAVDGGRLFFESPDALVPQDSNGASGCTAVAEGYPCQDVYEWELPASGAEVAKGENTCTQGSPDFSATDGGCVSPLSNVAGDRESYFLDASPSGSDVFIATADELVLSDTDEKIDVYDVRVGGGFPVTPAPPVCNNADFCKAPETPQPTVFGAPASATFAGPGNPPPPPPAVVKPAVKPKPLTRAQKLANALKVCAKDKKKSKRAKCQKQAKQKYGAKKSAKKATNDRRGN
jgi:hypothetical protein